MFNLSFIAMAATEPAGESGSKTLLGLGIIGLILGLAMAVAYLLGARTRGAKCPNCGAAKRGEFCSICGTKF